MIHVVGGTYLESCHEPAWYELYGSGLRASLALEQLKTRVRFSTFAGADQSPVLLARSERIKIIPTETERTVIFSYLHALSKPSIEPDDYVRHCAGSPKQIEVDSEKVLRFGMIEGSAKIKGKMVTYDPQTPSAPPLFHENGSKADRLAVVANRYEAERMTGQKRPAEACNALLRQGAEVAVVKCGADGCLVGLGAKITNVPAYRTTRVWPIGSGDVFSAIFAQGWMEVGLSPVAAADRASRGTSHFVQTQLFPSEKELKNGAIAPLQRLPRRQHKKVYLAGPFFNLPQRWLIEEFKTALQQAGLRVFSPLHEIGRGEAKVVYEPDMKGLRESGVVLACLDGLDPGTIYEVGYAHRQNAKVIAFVSAERPEDLKMVIGGGSEMTNDFATAVYLTVWAATCK